MKNLAIAAILTLSFIKSAAHTYGLNPNYMTRVAKCESTLNPGVTSRNGLYHGLYQYSWRTWYWMSGQAGWQGYSPYDAEAAAYVTAWAFSHGHASHWPRCRYA
jgi:hypothetical protein